ncbi:MAG: hypothetical protein IGS23_04380 [Rivularia sp. T60_A2020_040]|nr:hypothetical protein [Rivularia sp. T60_A2020_040]
MSVLTEALERFEYWLWHNHPEDEYLDAEEEFKKIVNKNNFIFNWQAILKKYNMNSNGLVDRPR